MAEVEREEMTESQEIEIGEETLTVGTDTAQKDTGGNKSTETEAEKGIHQTEKEYEETRNAKIKTEERQLKIMLEIDEVPEG